MKGKREIVKNMNQGSTYRYTKYTLRREKKKGKGGGIQKLEKKKTERGGRRSNQIGDKRSIHQIRN